MGAVVVYTHSRFNAGRFFFLFFCFIYVGGFFLVIVLVALAGLRALVVFYSDESYFLRVVMLLYMLLLLLVFTLGYYLYHILCALPWSSFHVVLLQRIRVPHRPRAVRLHFQGGVHD